MKQVVFSTSIRFLHVVFLSFLFLCCSCYLSANLHPGPSKVLHALMLEKSKGISVAEKAPRDTTNNNSQGTVNNNSDPDDDQKAPRPVGYCGGATVPCTSCGVSCCGSDIDLLRQCICNIQDKLIAIENFIKEILIEGITCVCDLDEIIEFLETIESKADECCEITQVQLSKIDSTVVSIESLLDDITVDDSCCQTVRSTIDNIIVPEVISIESKLDTWIGPLIETIDSKIDKIDIDPDFQDTVKSALDIIITTVVPEVISIESKLDTWIGPLIETIDSKIDKIDIDPDFQDTVKSAIDVIDDKIDTVDSKLDIVITTVIPEVVSIESKLDTWIGPLIETIDSKIDKIDIDPDFQDTVKSALDIIITTVVPEVISIESKLDTWIGPLVETIDSKVDVLMFGVVIISSGETITDPGKYILVDDIECPVTIASDNVELDLRGFDICGTCTSIIIEPGISNVTIKNGRVTGATDCTYTCSDGSWLNASGIWVGDGSQLIDIENMTVFGFEKGIAFAGKSNSQIRSSQVKDTTLECNNIGVFAQNTIKTEFENVRALNSFEAGFYQENSSYNIFKNSQALMTQNDDSAKRAIGFASVDGVGNLFDNIVVEGTKTTTGSLANGAIGILFEGDEKESKIINSVVNSTEVICNSTDIAAIAYGIKFSGVYNDLVLTSSYDHGNSVYAVHWSPNARYLAIGGDNGIGNNDIRILEHNRMSLSEIPQAEVDFGARVNTVSWGFSCECLAVGGENPPDGKELKIYSFDGRALSALSDAQYDHGAPIYSVDWTSDNWFLALGGGQGTGGYQVRVFIFDSVFLVEVENARYNHGSGIVKSVDWSPNGKYLAIGGSQGTGGYEVRVLGFNGNSLYDIAGATYDHISSSTVQSVAWSPNGSYLAIGGDNGIGNYEVRVLEFTGSTLLDIPGAVFDSDAKATGVSWSPNGEYLAVSFQNSLGDELQVFSFDGYSLLQTSTYNYGNNINSIHWSQNGKYIAIGGDGDIYGSDVLSFAAMDYPSKNLIDENKIANTASCVNSVGVSVSGGTNSVTRNISYDNDLNFDQSIRNVINRGIICCPCPYCNFSAPLC